MNQKVKVTEFTMDTLGLEITPTLVKKIIPIWWYSTRTKTSGGLRLTEQGFKCTSGAGLKNYKIKFDEPISVTNKLIIWIDNNIDCPFYITNKEIYVFSENMAVQLVLFSGNIQRFHSAKERFKEKQKIT